MFIPVQIPPENGELMYSWMERMSHANGFDGTEASSFRLFSKTYIHPNSGKSGMYEPHYDCHDDVGEFLLSAYPLDNLAEMYLDTNIFTGIALYMNQMRQTNYITRSVYPNDIGFDTLIHKFANAYINQAHICPDCAKEDIKEHGFYYLHREHHLPGIKCCPKHHCELFAFRGIRSHELDSTDFYIPTDSIITEADIRYAEFYKELLELNVVAVPEIVALAVRNKIHSMGYMKPDYPKLVEKIYSEGNQNLFKRDLLHFMNDRLSGMRGQSFDFEMITGLLCSIFESAQEFANAIEPDDSIKDKFYENILEYDYSLIGSYTPFIVVLKNNANDNIFITSPFGFNIGWRDPLEVSQLDESTMYETIVDTLTNGDYSVMTEFTSTDDPVQMRHNICGREYPIRAGSFLISNNRCVCETNLTIERAQKRMDDSSNGEYELLQYTNQHEDAVFRHKVCGTEITKMYSVMQRYPICPVCTPKIKKAKQVERIKKIERKKAKEKLEKKDRITDLTFKKQHDADYFSEQMKMLTGDEYELIGDFDSIQDRTEIIHHGCGDIITMTPGAFIGGRRCQCCEMLKGDDFADYVKTVSNGRYRINTRYTSQYDRMEIIDTETKAKKILPKCKIAQELYRPTESKILPCSNRRTDISPYVECNTTIVWKALRNQFGEKDIFSFSDIDLSKVGLNEEQTRAAITYLMKNGRLYSLERGWYCLTDYNHSDYEIAYYMFCERNGHRIGIFRADTLASILAEKPIGNRYFIRSNIGSKYKNHRIDIKGITITDFEAHIPITDDNVPIITMMEYAKLSTEKASPYYDKIREYAEENGLTYEICAEMALQYSDRPRLIDSGLQRIFGLIAPDEHVDRVSEILHDSLYNVIVNNMPESGIITKQEIVALGFNSGHIIGALRQLVAEGLIIRTAIGKYALPDNPDVIPMETPDRNALDDKAFTAWLHENYDGITIIPENVTYNGYDTRYISGVLQRYERQGIVKRIERGLYLTNTTELTVEEALSSKYLYGEGHKQIGYVSGEDFEYAIGLREEKPDRRHLMSNRALNNKVSRHSGRIHRKDLLILVKKPRCEIDEDNYKILPALDFLVKFPNHSDKLLAPIRKYLDDNSIKYEDCEPYLDYYRPCVKTKLQHIFGIHANTE